MVIMSMVESNREEEVLAFMRGDLTMEEIQVRHAREIMDQAEMEVREILKKDPGIEGVREASEARNQAAKIAQAILRGEVTIEAAHARQKKQEEERAQARAAKEEEARWYAEREATEKECKEEWRAIRKGMRRLSAISCTAAGLLVLALCPMPGWYYAGMKVAVFLFGLLAAVVFFRRGMEWRAVLAAGIAVIFNPVFRIGLDRYGWMMMDLVCAIVVMVFLQLPRKED